LHVRLAGAMNVARYHGVDPDPRAVRLDATEIAPSARVLVEWLRQSGLWAKGARLTFRQLLEIESPAPILLLLSDGGAALMVGRNRDDGVVLVRDPRTPVAEPVPVDELRLKQVWDGVTVLVRTAREGSKTEEPFNLGLLTRLVWGEKSILRDVALGSVTVTILSVLPVLMIMSTLNTVVMYQSVNTLTLIVTILLIALGFEMLITWSRRMLLVILASRLDTRLNLAIFDRLMTLPIDFFERNQAGELSYKIAQLYRVREFLTGRMTTTFIDLTMVLLLLPVLFYMEATLAWTVLIAAGCIALIIAAFLGPLARMTDKLIQAESDKGSTLVESIYGIRTVKSLCLEGTRAAEWDQRVARVGDLNLRMGRLSNWPMVLVMPFEKYTQVGVLALGAYIALTSNNPLSLGALIGFMMLGGRVAAPLVSLARLLQDVQEARVALSQVGWVLNRETEKRALTHGLRHQDPGARQDQFLHRTGHDARSGRPLGLRQVHDHPPAHGDQPRLFGLGEDRRHGFARDQPAPSAPELRRRAAGELPVPRLGEGQYPRRAARPQLRGRGTRGQARRRRRVHRAPASGLRDLDPGGIA
jgi:ABC-type bacteriocin/lantibiotic exporter with double-glycine peptidase domain